MIKVTATPERQEPQTHNVKAAMACPPDVLVVVCLWFLPLWRGSDLDHKLSRPSRRANRAKTRDPETSVRHRASLAPSPAPHPAAATIVDVLLPVALDQSYSYRVPAGLDLVPGDLVCVPLGS